MQRCHRARGRLPRPPAERPRSPRPHRPRQHRRRLGSRHGRRQHRSRRSSSTITSRSTTSSISDINPTVGLFPKPGKEQAVYDALVKAHPRLRVFRRSETPEAWHYRDHPESRRSSESWTKGWQIMRRATRDAIREGRASPAGGQHGYDPALMSMRGVFVAAGPAFRQGADGARIREHPYLQRARAGSRRDTGAERRPIGRRRVGSAMIGRMPDTAGRIRAFLLATLAIGMIGMTSELLLIGHRETVQQQIPLMLLGLGIVAAAMARGGPARHDRARIADHDAAVRRERRGRGGPALPRATWSSSSKSTPGWAVSSWCRRPSRAPRPCWRPAR